MSSGKAEEMLGFFVAENNSSEGEQYVTYIPLTRVQAKGYGPRISELAEEEPLVGAWPGGMPSWGYEWALLPVYCESLLESALEEFKTAERYVGNNYADFFKEAKPLEDLSWIFLDPETIYCDHVYKRKGLCPR